MKQAQVKRHWCAEAWDGHTVRWVDGQMVIGGQGFVCVRKYYERQRAQAAQP
jgi:hypothetical protein